MFLHLRHCIRNLFFLGSGTSCVTKKHYSKFKKKNTVKCSMWLSVSLVFIPHWRDPFSMKPGIDCVIEGDSVTSNPSFESPDPIPLCAPGPPTLQIKHWVALHITLSNMAFYYVWGITCPVGQIHFASTCPTKKIHLSRKSGWDVSSPVRCVWKNMKGTSPTEGLQKIYDSNYYYAIHYNNSRRFSVLV